MGGRGVYSTVKYKKALENLEQYGNVSGALDSNSPEADKFAKMIYVEIRKRKDDYKTIAKNTGIKEENIKRVKDYIFNEKHLLDGKMKYFAPSYSMAQSWIRLTVGNNIQKHDLTMLKHEIVERLLISKYNYSQDKAHTKASKKYNYAKEVKKYEQNKKYKQK